MWDPIITWMSNKLVTWKGKFLSYGGRITLIKASFLFTHIFHVFVPDFKKGNRENKQVAVRLLMVKFFLKTSCALASWKLIQLPTKLGGFSVENLLHRNLALLLKWVWRYFREPNALWQQVIMNKYSYSPSFTIHDLEFISQGGPWNKICNSIIKHHEEISMLLSKIRKRVRNGVQTSFSHKLWLGIRPLKMDFPCLFKLATTKIALVASVGVRDGYKWIWCFHEICH